MKVLIMNGINLCMLGTREPDKYGKRTLDDIIADVKEWAKDKDIEVDDFVTNYEGEFVEKLYAARGVYDGLVMNCGAWSHYSIGIRDAVSGCGLPAIDVHISNISSRESFRHESLTAPCCLGMIAGLGTDGYEWALRALISKLGK